MHRRLARLAWLAGLCAALAAGVLWGQDAGTHGEGSGERVVVRFYLMSQCPFAVQVLEAFQPVLEQMPERIDFRYDFIGTVEGNSLDSMHGKSEVQGDAVELCAQKYLAAGYRYMKLVTCMGKDFKSIPDNWKACASQIGAAKGDVEKVKTCADGWEGHVLLKASFSASKDAGASGSPTMYVAGSQYKGPRTTLDFSRAVCAQMHEPKPESCLSLPEPVRVNAIILEDRRCTSKNCNTARIEDSLKGLFPGLALTRCDWSDDECKRLFEQEGLDTLPAVLFDDAVERGEGYDRVSRYLRRGASGRYWVFQLAATHDPRAEICDNGVDDTGDGRADCKDPTCKDTMVCRPEIKAQVDLFIMSHCPFAAKALDALLKVLPEFDSKLKIRLRYVGEERDGRLTSMHGDEEVAEDLRQVCVFKRYPKRLLAYIKCRLPDIRNDEWKPCAVDGIDAEVIQECATGQQGHDLLAAEFELSGKLDIRASPTWLINNRYLENGIDPDAVRGLICKHNPGLKACK